MIHLVTIDEIVTDRVLSNEEGLDDLAASIKKSDLTEPILLTEEMILIDGLRRIEAHKRLGRTVIEAYVSDSPLEIFSRLEKIHKGVQLNPRRIYEFHLVLRPVFARYKESLRAQGRWHHSKRRPEEIMARYGDITAKALNLPYSAYIQRINRLYSQLDIDNPLAVKAIQLMEAGELSPSGAADMVDGKYNLSGDITSLSEQRQVLRGAVRNLSGIIKALQMLGSPIKLPYDELGPIKNQILAVYKQLGVVNRLLNRELESKRKNS